MKDALSESPGVRNEKSPCAYFCLHSLLAAGLAMFCGCASPHNAILANDPLVAFFTKADIPRVPAPVDPSRTYDADVLQMWSAVNRVIQVEHGVVIASSQPSGII